MLKLNTVLKTGDKSLIKTTDLYLLRSYFCKILKYYSSSAANSLKPNMYFGIQTNALYFNFSKAFDKLDYKLLLSKLSQCGFSQSHFYLFKDYYSNYEQFITLNVFRSSGVHQESVLVFVLFNIFVTMLVKEKY